MLNRLLKIGAIMVTGLFLAVFTYQSYDYVGQQLYLASDIETIFTVNAIVIPDYVLGDDPPIIYDRDILISFIGDYRAELKSIVTGDTVCFGSGLNIKYDAGEKTPEGVTFTWLAGVSPGGDCDNPDKVFPGQYYLEINYAIRQEGLPERYLYARSNVFDIFPPGYVPLTELTVQDQVDRGIEPTNNLTLIP